MVNECLVDAEKLTLEREELLDELVEFLKLKLPEFNIEREGNNIVIKSENEVSKRRIRLFLKKFLHKNELDKNFKAVSGGGNTIIILKLAAIREETE